MPEESVVVSMLQPAADLELIRTFVRRRITAFSLDLLPRISRAQAMDSLSSQATVSGYRAALIAAADLPRFFPMFMTAAGTVPPAKVLVLGAGVAGLQAIATARRLGAVVRAYDVRPAAREEVRSLGATFVELELEAQEGTGGYAREQSEDFLRRQRELIGKEVAAADAVITTAAIPGRRAPVLVTAEMVGEMRPGSVIVDLAAESGGNCELSEPGETVVSGGVSIYGARNLPSTMAVHASFLYSRNIAEVLGLMTHDGSFSPDFDDEIVAATCVTQDGAIRHAPDRRAARRSPHVNGGDILSLVTVFVLAAFVGFEVISKVPSILHTPLMSGTNAIHGVVLVGSMIVLGEAHGVLAADSRLPGGRAGDAQRRRWLRRHGPDARDVQGPPDDRAPGPGPGQRPGGPTRAAQPPAGPTARRREPRDGHPPRLPRGGDLLHPRPPRPDRPEDRPCRQPHRRGRHAPRHRDDLRHPRPQPLRPDGGSHGGRGRDRPPGRPPRQDDGHAADGGGLQRRRRRGGGSHRPVASS